MRKILCLFLLLFSLINIVSCNKCKCSDKCNCGSHCNCNNIIKCNDGCKCGGEGDVTPPMQTVNIYVENSGSMQGFFNGESDIKDIIKMYWDRIEERQRNDSLSKDTITLNYIINTTITNSPVDIKTFLAQSHGKCTEQYSKIDDILQTAMNNANDSTINIVVSDYSLTSDNASFGMAQSGITRIFAKQLEGERDMAVAILKYTSKFKGNYFPGPIPHDGRLPFYIWCFGTSQQVNKIVNLPIKTKSCGELFLQPKREIVPRIKSDSPRMIEGNAILVNKWDKDRGSRDSTSYSVRLEVMLSDIIASENDLLNSGHYSVSDGYRIASINKKSDDVYEYTILTRKPSPGKITIAYQRENVPAWVENSNFERKGEVPPDSMTYGVKYLIGGVFDAYNNMAKEIFEINVELKK